ncbi:hypothetical protein BGZ95_010459 [Linnemannia exigua]|uniref:Uncharacterized protein n=1 Tax=Linnemannia exigua TaxID=604196 RepID=A0AAD4DMD7_9FUNG|nr:hypothetical protein BGZ95_010459 [Linnemannia exigua]
MPGSDNSHSAQIALERLRLHQDESISTTFTEEEKLALIEHGRIIGNRGSWDREDYQRINNGINTINHHRQQRQRTSPYPIYPLLRGRTHYVGLVSKACRTHNAKIPAAA